MPNNTILEELSVDDCLALVSSVPVGRIAISQADAPPHVVPVNFTMRHGAVIFRTDGGTKLRQLRGAVVTFQVDSIDVETHSGWSVMIQGPAFELNSEDSRDMDLDPWGPEPKRHWVRVVPMAISGRRLDAAAS